MAFAGILARGRDPAGAPSGEELGRHAPAEQATAWSERQRLALRSSAVASDELEPPQPFERVGIEHGSEAGDRKRFVEAEPEHHPLTLTHVGRQLLELARRTPAARQGRCVSGQPRRVPPPLPENGRHRTDPDPDANRFDLGSDPIEYASVRLQTVKDLLPGLVDRSTKEGDDYTQARRAFNVLVAQYGQSMFFVSRYVGGLETSRSHKGDKDAKPPVTLIDVKKQRDALGLLEENIFSDKNFQFSPELLNQLGWTNWSHWGVRDTTRKDFGIHDFVLQWQTRILNQLLSSVTLKRMHDAELKAPPETDVLTTAELLQRLTKTIFSEVESTKEGEYTNRKPAISSLRRNLQRTHLEEMAKLALGTSSAPDDCQTVAYAELANLQQRIKSLLDNTPVAGKLDVYSRAHLQESAARIAKVLDARFQLPLPTSAPAFSFGRSGTVEE